MSIWTTEPVGFESVLQSERVITGCASQAVFDKTGELITAEALEKAIPMFKKLPIISVEHRDLPVGVCDDVWMEGDKMMIKARIKDTPDCDLVWDFIKSGSLNAFSISGRRTNTTCKTSPGHCVTDGIILTSITLCGDNKCNPGAYLEIQKTLFGNVETSMTEVSEDFKISEDFIQQIITKTVDAAKESLVVQVAPDVEKADEGARFDELTSLIKTQQAAIDDLKKTIEAATVRIQKLEDEPVQKAELQVLEKVAKEINVDPRMAAFAKTYRNPTGTFRHQ